MSASHVRDGAFNPTSPHSSTGLVDSFKGTPDTRFSAFSPEEGSSKSHRAPHSVGGSIRESGPIKFRFGTPHSLNLPSREPLFHRDNSVGRDPFVSSSGPDQQIGRRLSPTASSFAPSTAFLGTRSSKSDFTYRKADGNTNEAAKETDQDLRSKSGDISPREELSTDVGISRCVMIMDAVRGNGVRLLEVEQYISSLEQKALNFKSNKQIHQYGDKVYVRFNNIRDTCLFSENARMSGRDWILNYIHPREFSQVIDPTSGLTTAHEGQLTMAIFAPPSMSVDQNQLLAFLHSTLSNQGDVFALKVCVERVQGSVLSAVVEFCENDVSLQAVANTHGKVIGGYQFCMALHRPDIPAIAAPAYEKVISPMRTTPSSADFVGDFQRLSLANRAPSSMPSMTTNFINTPTRSPATSGFSLQPSYGVMPVVYHGMPMSPPYMMDPVSPRIHSMLPAGNYSWVGPMYSQQPAMMSPEFMTPRQFNYQRDARRQNAIRVNRSPYQHHNVTGQHNHVDVDRIREGGDVRTTIMLRNIPNKVGQVMLKEIVDESSWGKYDFMYLRIDFANDCNVGYAFINFVDPLDIIDFVNKRGNQRWNCFKSDKVAEISYATIQGKDCLVQKFRNSSVMLEAAHYRPKLYYTINGPQPELSGNEEPFPDPDNQSKMKRSCENAEHVGLFTPNAGQHYRDEQRRRRSQFDRGTRLAAMEEYDFPNFESQPYSPQ